MSNSTQKQKIENVNLYFILKDSETRDDFLKNINPYEKYIITINESIQIENRELRNKIKDLENEIKDYTEEIDTNDVSKRYTKGLLIRKIKITNF